LNCKDISKGARGSFTYRIKVRCPSEIENLHYFRRHFSYVIASIIHCRRYEWRCDLFHTIPSRNYRASPE